MCSCNYIYRARSRALSAAAAAAAAALICPAVDCTHIGGSEVIRVSASGGRFNLSPVGFSRSRRHLGLNANKLKAGTMEDYSTITTQYYSVVNNSALFVPSLCWLIVCWYTRYFVGLSFSRASTLPGLTWNMGPSVPFDRSWCSSGQYRQLCCFLALLLFCSRM